MNYGDLKTHFNNVLNRSDITTALTTTFNKFAGLTYNKIQKGTHL